MSNQLMTQIGSELRPFTEEELEQRKSDHQTRQEMEAQFAIKQAAREAAIAHAKSLGFTDEMIAVMYPGLTD